MKLGVLALVAVCLLSANVQAQEACTTEWQYKVVQTGGADSLEVKRTDRRSAGASLEHALNRLGKNGWELISGSELVIQKQYSPEGISSGLAKFESGAVLFKRRISSC